MDRMKGTGARFARKALKTQVQGAAARAPKGKAPRAMAAVP